MTALLQSNERDIELYGIFLSLRRKGVGYKEAISRAAHSPTSRYWVSLRYIYLVMMDRLEGNNKRSKRKSARPERQKLEDSLYSDLLSLRKTPEFRGCSLYFMVCFIICRPAPSFYISDDRAYVIIRKMHKKNSAEFTRQLIKKQTT